MFFCATTFIVLIASVHCHVGSGYLGTGIKVDMDRPSYGVQAPPPGVAGLHARDKATYRRLLGELLRMVDPEMEQQEEEALAALLDQPAVAALRESPDTAAAADSYINQIFQEAIPFQARPVYRGKREGEEEQDGKKVGNVVLPWEMKYFSPMLRGKK